MGSEESKVSVKAESAQAWIESVLGSGMLGSPELIQELWSGYGRIERLTVDAPGVSTVILKAVDPPLSSRQHPRGWSTDRSRARKVRSYEVEREFYRTFAGSLSDSARVPRHLGSTVLGRGSLLLLEDLDAAGYGERRRSVNEHDVHACLDWLAAFHASFLGVSPIGLWERGTYWHLATRPDELAATTDSTLVEAAPRIDARLGEARYRTLVHGDAKLANFCFPGTQPGGVAALDFQYVGGGTGVQDVAYFLGSCFEDAELEPRASTDLDYYFQALGAELGQRTAGGDSPVDRHAVEAEWRALWPFAWADFHRFLAGWSPGHWKLSRYSEAMLRRALTPD